MMKIPTIILLMIIVLASCDGRDSDKSDLGKVQSELLFETILKSGEREKEEFITLLAIKYGLNKELTSRVIKEFGQDDTLLMVNAIRAKTTKEFERLRADYNNRPMIVERIKRISDNNEVDQQKIAALLIDYKMWQKAETNMERTDGYAAEPHSPEPYEQIR